ncbi:MAG TPA: hypothetical protein VGW75_06725 [Solirubrobacteraceae bacterium]|nr:hypothetical protein [Solirubrobacteraceae bacterium]
MRPVVAAVVVVTLLPATASAADPAALDRTYGANGVAMSDGAARRGALLPDGRAVLAGHGADVQRIGLDGRPDRSFGRRGRTGPLLRGLVVRFVAVASDGTIALAGSRAGRVVLVRIAADGALVRALELGPWSGVVAAALGDDGTAYVVHDRHSIARIGADGSVTRDWARAPGDAEIGWLRATPTGLLAGVTVHTGDDLANFSAMYEAQLIAFDRAGAIERLTSVGDGLVTALAPAGGGALLSSSTCNVYKDDACSHFGFDVVDAAGAHAGRVRTRDHFGETSALAVEGDGDVLAAGQAVDRLWRSSDFYVRRYTDGRRLDRTFGRCGGAPVRVSRSLRVAELAVQRSRRIVALLAARRYSGHPWIVAALRGGDGRAPLVPPAHAARTSVSDQPIGAAGRSQPVYMASDVPATVRVRAIVTGFARDVGPPRRGLGARERRRLGLPRVAGTVTRRVVACAPRHVVRMPLHPQVTRWLRSHGSALIVRLEAVARNRSGVVRAVDEGALYY